MLRRSTWQGNVAETLEFPDLILDHVAYRVVQRDKVWELPPKEMELLWFLASHKNQVFTRDQLLQKIWGFEYYGDTRTVDVHVKRLREKLLTQGEAWQIKTVWGVGYKFEVEE
jgi:DNA-binding response OmpR family regulator